MKQKRKKTKYVVLVPFDATPEGAGQYEIRGGFFCSQSTARKYAQREWLGALVAMAHGLLVEEQDIVSKQEPE